MHYALTLNKMYQFTLDYEQHVILHFLILKKYNTWKNDNCILFKQL